MGVASGCGCKEVYRFHNSTYPYSSSICSFLQQHPYFLFIKKNVFHSFRRRKKKNDKSRFFTSLGAFVNMRYILMLYTHSIGNQP